MLSSPSVVSEYLLRALNAIMRKDGAQPCARQILGGRPQFSLAHLDFLFSAQQLHERTFDETMRQ